jgi:MFS family permease
MRLARLYRGRNSLEKTSTDPTTSPPNRPTGVAVVFGVGGLLSAAAVDVWMFAFCRFLTGIGVGSMIPVADSLMIEWSPTEWRGKLAMTLTGVAFALGALFACIVGIVMHDLWGGEGAWWR